MAPLPGVGLGAVDIQETPTSYIFKVDVPGLSKDDVKGAGPVDLSRFCVAKHNFCLSSMAFHALP